MRAHHLLPDLRGPSRRKLGAVIALALVHCLAAAPASAQTALLDPATQPKFVNNVPDALAPGFIYQPTSTGSYDYYEIGVYPIEQPLGLVDPVTGAPLLTQCFAYGTGPGFPNATYPGRTFIAQKDHQVLVRWMNNLTEDGTPNGPVVPHLLPVDETLHWAFALPGYEMNQIETDGVPIVTHLHGGHTEAPSDGNPEYWFTPGFHVKGPRWTKEVYVYDNDQQAGTLWYHDHGLGITRLNVYAGLAGFYILRDTDDTGEADNPLGLPAYPYEQLLVIQDHMFDADGQHFYPAFPGDPGWDDFIGDNPNAPVPSALAEFFGDFILVNGVPWPKMEVEPRVYRLRLLNGSDSRVYKLWLTTDLLDVQFHVIGNDDGLLYEPVSMVDKLVIAPGERYDVLVDFSPVAGQQVVMKNNARGPFPGGAVVDPQTAGQIMAFNVGMTVTDNTNNAIPATLRSSPISPDDILGSKSAEDRTRKLALFEGLDDKGRLQPLLGTAEPTEDVLGGTQNGALVWDECRAPITENPGLDDVEIWEVYNATEDAHPFHVHLVSFQILDRQRFKADVLPKEIIQHDGSVGVGSYLANIKKIGKPKGPDPFESGWKDTAVMYPGEVTRVMARFDRPGRYVYHCHILSHEDHEMMRPYHVGPWTPDDMAYECHDDVVTRQLAEAVNDVSTQPEDEAAGLSLPPSAAGADIAFSMTLSPNPFHRTTRISFALPQEAHARLAVYDIRGRLVNVLTDGERTRGVHQVVWNGEDRNGARVASGTYFARLETGVGSVVHKLVFTK